MRREQGCRPGRRRDAAARALAAEGRDGAGMGQEERRFLPDSGDQLVEIVGGRGTGEGGEALVGVDGGEQPEAGIVE